MRSVTKMKSVISPCLSNPAAPFAIRFQSLQNKSIFSRSKVLASIASIKNPVNVVSLAAISSSLKPLQNPSQARSLSSDAACSPSSSGEIHVIVGPMFAGKTTTLLRRMKSESNSGRNVAVIKSDKDCRYALDSIVTHDGEKLPCWALAHLSSFKQKIGIEAYDKLEVIGIDEAQFFDDLYDFCHKAADHDGKTVIVAGLDGDYLRRRFGAVLEIVPLADTVTKLTSRCELCGNRALFTLRKTEETETEVVGGAEVYMPVCRKHYVSGQVVKEATKTILEAQKVECSAVF